MATAKKTTSVKKEKKSYKIEKKRSGRFSVVGTKGAYINGIEKTKILVKEGLVKSGLPKAPAAEAAPEAQA